MKFPHILVMPYPILGHMNPLLQFSNVLSRHGCKITFVISEFNQKRVKTVASDGSQIKFVTLPDGLDPEDDRSDQPKVILSLRRTMPPKLHKLIEDINDNALDCDNRITCLLVSKNIGWALEVGHNLGIKGALLWPASATSLAAFESIQSLVDEGIIDPETGLPTRKQEIQLIPNSPMMDTAHLPWCTLHKNFFHHMVEDTQTLKLGDWWLCNTTSDLEPGVLDISPKILPIGPLMSIISETTNNSSFWREDTTCLDWLDQHQPQSVTYVSFGSLATIEPNQFKELALGLNLLNKPFLWVVRVNEGKIITYPDEFYGSKGKIVGWAPQKRVLNHPAIACFISHCGWNSTVEGVCGGVPFICWPFFSDQFVNKSYICDVWKVGLELEKDESGLVPRSEIREKVELVVGDEEMKGRSLKLKELTLNNLVQGGCSSMNLEKFINWAKE